MVRLEEGLGCLCQKLQISFQFQYGSIGRAQDELLDLAYVGFNSSMVRLEDLPDIKTISSPSRFNSSMVRLEVGRTVARAFGRDSFQFQYGSIGRIVVDLVTSRFEAFQFQYGSIGS